MPSEHLPQLGVRANLAQFSLLVAVNALVGGMVGVQRTVVPLLAEHDFHIAAATAATSFIVAFGVVKAITNLLSGALADAIGRRRVLILGWMFGLPVPFLIMWAPAWSWIVAANVLLGINQGLAWSMTVTMKVDLAGPGRRGLALGLNECAGYAAVGATAWITGWIAAHHGLRPAPFWLAVGYAVAGSLLSILLVRETRRHAAAEQAGVATVQTTALPRGIFAIASWSNRDLQAVCQAGLVNNLNDGMAWGILPLLLSARGVGIDRIGLIVSLYPLCWGIGQVFTGALSDRLGRKQFIVWGMWIQAIAHAAIAFDAGGPIASGTVGCVLLGIGTAMVYPTLLAAVGDIAAPAWRARALSVYRFWRDLGYAIGALGAGVIADSFGLAWSVHAAGMLTFFSGTLVAWRMRESLRTSADIQ